MAYDAYYDFYEGRGFSFDRETLTSYCLSLYTKPFVILSGISGTGKTKIAQLFNTPALEPLPKFTPATDAEPPGQWIVLTITAGLLSKDARANLKYKDLNAILNEDEIAKIQPVIEKLREAGQDNNIGPPFPIVIETSDGDLNAEAYLQRASNPLLRVRFKSRRGAAMAYDSTAYLARHYKVGDALRLEKIGERRFRIAAVNEQSVVQKLLQLDAEEKNIIKNTCFISVRSDWTDASPLFGYYNLVDQRFHITPLISFILTAHEHPELPFFLVLDEMNLAKVEHYFSDFLSSLESRHLDGAKLNQEPIRLHGSSGWVETNDEYFDIISSTLELPPNLFVTGTVNIDESTYMFSPKVLDRANVIELNEIDLVNYGGDGAKSTSESVFMLKEFPVLTNYAIANRSDYQNLLAPAKSVLNAIHALLTRYQLQFGYRVINEVSRFLNNAHALCVPHESLQDRALDFQIVQKILPKFNGPQSKLDAPIRELLQYLVLGKDGTLMDMDAVGKLVPSDTKYPKSVAKLQRMSLALATNGFANFIE